MHRYKFFGHTELSVSYARIICSCLRNFSCTDFDVVVPVPLSKERMAERGFNQSELIARKVSEAFSVPCISNELIKRRHTKRQSELPMSERFKNVRGAFALNKPDKIRDKRVLLIDDIYATGATMREAALVLSGTAKNIIACTAAKTNMNKQTPYR